MVVVLRMVELRMVVLNMQSVSIAIGRDQVLLLRKSLEPLRKSSEQ